MLHKKGIFLAAAFAVPVLCCLIGIGAFVLATTPIPPLYDSNEPPQTNDITQQIKEQEEIAKKLENKLTQIKERIRWLHNELKNIEARIQIAQKTKEIVSHLESVSLSLRKELSFLYQQLHEMQRGAQQLDVLDAEINETNDTEEDFQKDSEHSQQQNVRLSNLVDVNRNSMYREQEG